MAGIDAARISYPGTPQAITDLLGGRIEFVITDVAVTRDPSARAASGRSA
jgi:tripartite-type tricarboxylate transporter receptor subunit TctC